MPPSAIAIAASSSDSGLREPLLVIAVREQPERAAPLDDREHLQAPVLAQEVRDRGVARPRGWPRLAVARVGVRDRLLRARSPRSTWPRRRRDSSSRVAVPQRQQQRLVEEVLDHHRGVAEGVVREALARLRGVELLRGASCGAGRSRSARARSLLGGQIEVEPAVEPAGAQQRGVEGVGPVRGRDEQDVVVPRACRPSAAGRWAGSRSPADELARGRGRAAAADRTTASGSAARSPCRRCPTTSSARSAAEARARRRQRRRHRDMPSRDPPIASISSMNPIAPPSLRAALRSALKNERIR